MRVQTGLIEVRGTKRGNQWFMVLKGSYHETGSANGNLGESRITKRMARALLGWHFNDDLVLAEGTTKLLGSYTVHLT